MPTPFAAVSIMAAAASMTATTTASDGSAAMATAASMDGTAAIPAAVAGTCSSPGAFSRSGLGSNSGGRKIALSKPCGRMTAVSILTTRGCGGRA